MKIYTPKGSDPVHALDGVDLSVRQGTVRALLGPNGAGKTTMVKVLTTLIKPDAGHATIDGIDVVRDAHRIRPIIGVSGQYAAVDENLTGLENLDMVGRLYHLGAKATRRRATELIESFELTEAQNRPVKGFSGGMRRRIDLAGAIFSRPAGALPRRADDGPRPAQPARHVGCHHRPRRRGHDRVPHHAVPRGGRPPGR